MAKLSFCIIPSRANADGSLDIRLKITNKNSTAYIITRFKIDNIKQWKDGKVVKHPDAELMNKKLRGLLMGYEEIVDAMPNPNVSAAEIKKYIENQSRKSDSFKAYGKFKVD
ncbi:hypothetical protein [uncultured Muribaculum sp.]|uniref:hypothetical protein n=1 Tax=uncultured Muribaculum sp. TaxID=1918613 RepID=UPI0025AFAF28|nr:hypothetical protein [uncultured Muribaculum sp.]